VNRFKIDPVPVQQGTMSYPATIEPWLKETVPGFIPVDTEAALKELGNAKALNIVMLGSLSRHLPFTGEQWESAIRECVKEKFIDLNLAAFKAGKNL
jgi:indolepyruvate ferredoxin oxidoreductase, beta subunit